MKGIQRIISVLLAFCLVLSMLPIQVFAAESPVWETVESGEVLPVTINANSEDLQNPEPISNVVPFSIARSGGDKMDTSYLTISLDKYGQKVSASSSGSNEVEVLEYTQWQMSARFVRVYDGKIEADLDVTDQCTWTSSDSSGTMLSVTDAGLVTAYKASDEPYSITASYEGFIGVPGEDSTQVDEKTFVAQMDFNVILPRIAEEDADALRSLALIYLANYEWDSMVNHQGLTVSDWARQIQERIVSQDPVISSPNNSKTETYLHTAPYENSARILHFLSAAAGAYTIEACVKNSDAYVRAVCFHSDTDSYLAYAYASVGKDMLYATNFASKEGNGTRRYELLSKADYSTDKSNFQDAWSLYKAIAGNDDSIKVIGQYYGGTIAKFVAYVTGCNSVTFNSPSPLQYVYLNNFEEMCQHYCGETQISYNYTDSLRQSTVYYMEPMYVLTRNYESAIEFLSYSIREETICVKQSEELRIEREHTLWNRCVYLGSNQSDVYDDTGALSIKINESSMFGGDGADQLTAKFAQRTIVDIPQTISDIFEYSSLLIGEASTLPRKAKLLKLAKNIPGFLIEQINKSTVDTNILVGGAGDDVIKGSAWNNSFCYTAGGGNDTFVLYGMLNKFFLLGYDSNVQISHSYSSDNKLIYVLINNTDSFTIDTSHLDRACGVFYFFVGTPFDNGLNSVYTIKPRFDPVDVNYWRYSCPVDVVVLDASGAVVQELLDGVEYSATTEYGAFDVSLLDGEYIKTVVLYDSNYSIQARGVGNGTMKYCMGTILSEIDENQYCSIEGVPVTEGAIYYSSLNLDEAILNVDSNADGVVDNVITYDTTVSFPQDTYEISFGTQKQLTVDVSTSSTDRECVWFSTDDSVVTVDEEGEITAMGFGEAEIYAMVADGSGAYDSCKVTVPEEALSAENFTITGLESSYDYTGEVIDVQLLVSYGSFPLVQDVHYTAEFSELVEPGKATLTIIGINDYSGTVTRSYEILAPEEPDTVAKKVDWVAEQCRKTGITDPWDIALWLHDWLIYNANYDYTYTYYHPEGVLLNGTGVCQSYAEAYALLLNEFSIENKVLSAPEMDHAWNLVKIDGEWCHIDCTWDDPGTGGAENYTYFGMTDALMQRDHTWDTSAYPASISQKNYYLIRNDANVVESQQELEDFLARMAQDQTADFECYYIGGESEFSIYESFLVWLNSNDWKYGIANYSIQGSNWMLRANLAYTEPWDPPAEITDAVECPKFTLRGPDGVYPMENYTQNGVVLIFGREICSNTMALLSSLQPKLADLNSQGIEVFVNLENTNVASDYAALEQEYPGFVYTYYDRFLYSRLAEQIGLSGVVYYPVVYIIMGGEQIVGTSTGYVQDIDSLLSKIKSTATNVPLPSPEAVDENFYGSLFNYTGDVEALEKYIDSQIADGNPVIAAYDGTWTGDAESWISDDLGNAMIKALEKYRSDDRYVIPYGWSYYPGAQIAMVDITYQIESAHTLVTMPGKEATCTEAGLTEGEYCSTCGEIMVEQEVVEALGHDWSEWDIVDATCTVDGSKTRSCKRNGCNESETQTIPATGEHIYDQEIADAKYLVSEATNTTPAVYRKSCKCGAAGEETFTAGELKAPEFQDVPEDAYYYDPVIWAVANKITNGVGDGTVFEPDSGCTRAHVATFLWRAAGEPAPKSTEMPFKDVPADEYFSTAVIWAAENGITTGTGDGTTFEPHATCTRGQIVTFLSRYLKGIPSSEENPFKDVPNGEYYTNAVLWAVEKGITNGVGDGTAFEPDSTCTRGMIVTFLYRALN